MPVQIRNNFTDNLSPAFDMIFFQQLNPIKEQFSRYLNVEQGPIRDRTQRSSNTGIDTIVETPEGALTNFGVPEQGFDKTYIFRTFRGGYSVSEEMIEDDLAKIAGGKMASTLGRSMLNAQEIDSATILNNAVVDTGPDAKVLLAIDHPNEFSGAAQSNRPANFVDLSRESLEAALINLEQTDDDTGFPIILTGWTLVIHPENRFNAMRILKSLLEPDSAQNAINPISQQGIKLMVSNYITDADRWFILAEQHKLTYIWRVKPQFTSDNDFNTGDAKWKARARWDVGYDTWRGVYGSTGN